MRAETRLLAGHMLHALWTVVPVVALEDTAYKQPKISGKLGGGAANGRLARGSVQNLKSSKDSLCFHSSLVTSCSPRLRLFQLYAK